jgi:hypothetical protein
MVLASVLRRAVERSLGDLLRNSRRPRCCQFLDSRYPLRELRSPAHRAFDAPGGQPWRPGDLATLQLLGKPLDLYGFIGLFLLLGLIKKNGIMLVDFAIMRRREGMNVEAAAVEAAIERLRPILMTTFAAIFGALPMAMAFGADGASRQPMGLCIVGGLAVAQILTFFCTPVFYIHMEYFQERYLDKVAFFKRSEGEFKQEGAEPA